MRNLPDRSLGLPVRTLHRSCIDVHRNVGIKELPSTDAFAVRAGATWLQYNTSKLKRYVRAMT
jgi:hypothetical protein